MKKYILIAFCIFFLFSTSGYGADIKITELTEDTAPTSDDLVPTVNAPGSSPANRKSTLSNFIKWFFVPGGSTNVTTITGNYAFGITLTNITNVTFPTSGTLDTTHAATTSIKALTETNGGIPYGTADNAYAWLAAGTAGYLLQGNGAGAPSWVTALANGFTATTQSTADKSTKIATTAYVDTPATQTVTTSDSGADSDHATQTVTPTANVSRLSIARTCSDDDGCTDTLAETGAIAGALVTITNIGTYHCDLADQAGVLDLVTTPFDLQAGESITLVYANSQWNEVSRAVKSIRSVTVGGFTASRGVKTDASGNLVVTTLTDTNLENSFAYIPVDTATDAEGKISMDKTTDQLRVYGSAQKVIPTVQYASFVVPAPVDTDDILIMKAPYGMTITAVNCIVQGTTSITGQLQECTSAGASCADTDTGSDITCDADGAADDGALANNSIDSGDWIMWKSTSASGTPTFLTVTFTYTVVAD